MPGQHSKRSRKATGGGSKYGNKRVQCRGMTFDSILERDRWIVLEKRKAEGKIVNLRRQVNYPLVVNDHLICTLRVDHVYADPESPDMPIEEDPKGVITDVARIKHKLFEALYGRKIKIIKKESLHD